MADHQAQQKQSLFYSQAQQYPQPVQQQLQNPTKYAQAPVATPFQAAPRRAAATITPQISPLSTSGSTSPTSPKNRPPRPIYMPAVLRPTEFPSKATPVSPKPEDGADADERTLRSNASFMSMGALSRLSRRSTDDSGKCVDATWNLDMFPKPTAAPTRAHWKPDNEAVLCEDATCKRYFSYFTRRHHCRKCGNIFCDDHSRFQVPLDQDAGFNPKGVMSRACAHCYGQFKEWRGRNSSLNASEGNATSTFPVVNSPASAISMGFPQQHTLQQRVEAAQSVPRDWSWSTF